MAQPFQTFRFSPLGSTNSNEQQRIELTVPTSALPAASYAIIGDTTPSLSENELLIENVDVAKCTQILWWPADYRVSLDLVDLDHTKPTISGPVSSSFSASITGKFIVGFYRDDGFGPLRRVTSTNKEPSQVIRAEEQLDERSWEDDETDETTHTGSPGLKSSFKFRNYVAKVSVNELIELKSASLSVQDIDEVESGNWSASASGTENPEELGAQGMIEMAIQRIYYRTDGTCDVIVWIDGFVAGGFGNGGEIITTPDDPNQLATATVTILGKPAQIYLRHSQDITGDLDDYSMSLGSLTYDVTPTQLWDYSTP